MADERRTPCSVVLEGGVTSAVVHASLLACLSRHYEFRQLGGASSGAVAAAAAAAAEFARRRSAAQGTAAFDGLGKFPAELAGTDAAGRTKLFRLFQPVNGGHAAFRVVLAVFSRLPGESAWRTARRVGAAAVRQTALCLVLALLLVAFAANALPSGCGAAWVLLCLPGWVLVVLPALACAALVWLLGLAGPALRALRGNHWGLCSGMDAGAEDATALTPVLHGLLQRLAGLEENDPLTFGHLWGPATEGAARRAPAAERQIDLQIITTAVSLARPVRLPGDGGGHDPLHEFFYDPAEWRVLFPEAVVAHLEGRGRPSTLKHADGRKLLALPAPRDWPVLMAVRFSLSFPLLLSAVPMYVAVLRRGRRGSGQPPTFEARKVYFSDGGITSNCPVHLFDAPLPRFPTFGVNLYRPLRGGRAISRSDTRDPELEAAATPDAASWGTPLGLIGAILSTTLGWRDSLQRSMPGFRERIVHVGLPPSAGGLNLRMPPPAIRRLDRVGKAAAMHLHRAFSTPRRPGEPNAWERHRWTRLRTTLSALRAYLESFDARVEAGDPDYLRLPGTSMPMREAFEDDAGPRQARQAIEGTRDLVRMLEASVPPDALDRNAPAPLPQLRASPPW